MANPSGGVRPESGDAENACDADDGGERLGSAVGASGGDWPLAVVHVCQGTCLLARRDLRLAAY